MLVCQRCGGQLTSAGGVCTNCGLAPIYGDGSPEQPGSTTPTPPPPQTAPMGAAAVPAVPAVPGIFVPAAGWNQRVKQLSGLATALRLTLYLSCVAAVPTFIAAMMYYNLVGKAERGGLVSQHSVDNAHTWVEATTWSLAACSVAVAVLMICWLHALASNAELLRSVDGGMLHFPWSKGWAIGSWFVPVLNLWVPVQMLLAAHRNVWRSRVVGAAGSTARGRGIGGLAVVWWIAWIGASSTMAGSSAANTSAYDAMRKGTPNPIAELHDLRGSYLALMIGSVLVVIAALLLATLVSWASDSQPEQVTALLTSARQAPGPGWGQGPGQGWPRQPNSPMFGA
jgi:hypothetical protein